VDVDPRKPELLRVGQFEGCFNCGECIDVCNAIHAPKAIPGFLTFSFPSRQHPQAKLPQAKLEE
jgi:ferredoxin